MDYLAHGIYLGFGLACILITSTFAQEYNGVYYNGELICAMPIVQGPCEAAIPSWGLEGGVCRQFNYGGCDGNDNRFESLAACEAVCIPVDCTAPIVTGPCRGSFPRWGSNNDGVCEEFIYGGCQGNSNNFESQSECESACPTPTSPPPVDCNAPLVSGMCQAYFPSWGHKDGQCQEFVYGGCGGNSNRFGSQSECESACPTSTSPPPVDCNAPLVTGMCAAFFPSWGHKDGLCQEFVYGGCGGNSNRFGSQAECEAGCPPAQVAEVDCNAPLLTGPCRGFFTKWGSRDGVCEQFTYGGCQGNTNNFDSPAECETACPPTPVIDPPAVDCNAPLETGNCRASMPRWGFEDGSCQEFIYGGCGANTNNFVSQAECEVVCPPEPKADCNAPLETGLCRARKIRWGSNSEGVCVQFTYGGCGGNSNRFGSQEACEAACGSNTNVDTPVCDQELITGPCKALVRSWGFSNGKCRKFIYGGCMGNDNRFSTKKACQKQCDPSTLNRKPKLCKDSEEKGIFCANGKRRWFFNKETKKCTRSAGPVCKGNGKKKFGFSSRRVCEKRCN